MIEAITTQVPERVGKELLDLVKPSQVTQYLFADALVKSVLWRNQKVFTKRTLELLGAAGRYTGRDEVIEALLSVATEPDNAFNAKHLSSWLESMKLPQRDVAWTMWLMQHQLDEGDQVEAITAWTMQNGRAVMEEERAELIAITLSWLFTVSIRAMRDRATKALANLLTIRLKLAAKLIDRFASCDDAYVTERVLAAAYGAALQGLSEDGLSELATCVYGHFFAPAEARVHLLIRDYARGIIELAVYRGVLASSVDLTKARPPYRSPWPVEDVSKRQVAAYKQDYGTGKFSDQIVSSAVDDGDFARYIIDSSLRPFSALPMALAGLSSEEVLERWQREAVAYAPAAQQVIGDIKKSYEDVRISFAEIELSGARASESILKRGEPGRRLHPKARKSEKIVESQEKRLEALLSRELWRRYGLEAQGALRNASPWGGPLHWPPRFDVWKARRWVCKRAHDLGWKASLFGEFERNQRHGYSRMDHKVERIGKKYQWIALHELLALLADNAAFKGDAWGRSLAKYEGPWQISRRDIDPSLLIARTKDEAWHNWDWRWWLPKQVNFRPISARSRFAWLRSDADVLDDSSLIDVERPSDGSRWFVLNEAASWYGWAMRDGDRRLERQSWFRVQCVLVKESDRDIAIAALSKRVVIEEHDLPSVEIPWHSFLGEYPWHPAFANTPHWEDASSPVAHWGLPVKSMPTYGRYKVESGGYDGSIEDHISVDLPSLGLFYGLRLRLKDGESVAYANDENKIVYFDPSIAEPGHSAALVDREAFLAFLKREKLAAIWAIGGLRRINGGGLSRSTFGGERLFSSIYWLEGDVFEVRKNYEERRASQEQLHEFLAEDNDPLATDKEGEPSIKRRSH